MRGWHSGSFRVVYASACQLPRSVFVEAVESVRESTSARSPVAVLISILRDSVEERYAQQEREVARAAGARFGYGQPSAVDQLRADPEQWVRRLASRLSAEEVEGFLSASVADELERQRLRHLAASLVAERGST